MENEKKPLRERQNIQMNIFQIKAIKLVRSDEEVNRYLDKGWVLYRVFNEASYLVGLL